MTHLPKPPPGYSPKRYDEAAELQWVQILERMGPDTVRVRLSNGEIGESRGASVPFTEIIHANKSHMASRWFVDAWLEEQDRLARRRAEQQHRLLWAAVILSGLGVVASIGLAFV